MAREQLLKIAKPILFNTEMARAILNGRKTATRRCIKGAERDYIFLELSENPLVISTKMGEKKGYKQIRGLCATFDDSYGFYPVIRAPYKPGDILYVRETWSPWSRTEGTMPTIHYKADGENLPGVKWRPSIHMPKEAARIFLRVTDVRVERLQDITDGGIWREGVKYDAEQSTLRELFDSFSSLWDSTIPKKQLDTYGWDANPWVWVIEFDRLEVEE